MAPESRSRRRSAAPPGVDTSSVTGMARDVAARRLVTVTVVSSGAAEGVGAAVLRVHSEHTTALVPHGANRLANEISMLQTEHRAV